MISVSLISLVGTGSDRNFFNTLASRPAYNLVYRHYYKGDLVVASTLAYKIMGMLAKKQLIFSMERTTHMPRTVYKKLGESSEKIASYPIGKLAILFFARMIVEAELPC